MDSVGGKVLLRKALSGCQAELDRVEEYQDDTQSGRRPIQSARPDKTSESVPSSDDWEECQCQFIGRR